MEDTKGFTLVELLAVIIVLAIISVIGFFIVSNTIYDTRNSVEVQNARTLLKVVYEYVVLEEMNGNDINKEQIYVIQDDIEYILDENGNRTRTNHFLYNGKLCNYCIVKLRPNRQISILLEGREQDIKKEYDDDEVTISQLLMESRKVTSFYNELVLFKDLYVANNVIESTKNFESNGSIVYEIKSSGDKTIVSNLYHSSGNGTLKLIDSSHYTITIETENGPLEIDQDGSLIEQNINTEYSEEILALYEELQLVAEKYVSQHIITSEAYFEFQDGVINLVDSYGNVITDDSVIMDEKVMGSGELRINSSNQFSVTIYQDNYDIKNDYGNEKLYNENLKYSRDNVELFRNLSRLELLAENYLNGLNSNDYSPSQSDWLVFYYIRQLKYTGSMWNTVSGSDSNFVTYVQQHAGILRDYFTSKGTFTINGDTIDLKHMAAALATRMYQKAGGDYDILDQGIVDSMASWGGDLQTFMTNDLLPIVTEDTKEAYYNATMSLLGTSNTSFSMEDMLADIDAWVIYDNLISSNQSIYQAFDTYYDGSIDYSYQKRFTRFKDVFMNYYDVSKYQGRNGPINFRNTIWLYTRQKLTFLIFETDWPLFENYEIPSNMTYGVRDAFKDWIENKIELES